MEIGSGHFGVFLDCLIPLKRIAPFCFWTRSFRVLVKLRVFSALAPYDRHRAGAAHAGPWFGNLAGTGPAGPP